MSEAIKYYFADGDVRRGPLTLEQLRAYPLKADTMVWRDGLPEWMPLIRVPELAAEFLRKTGVPIPTRVQRAKVETDPAVPTPLAPPEGQIRLGTISLACGIACFLSWCPIWQWGFVFIGAPLAVTAIVTGTLAGRERRRTGIADSRAATGFWLGSVYIAVLVVLVSMVIVFTYSSIERPQPLPTTAPSR